VRSGDDDDGAIARDLPGTTRVNLAEEEVDENGKGPQPGIVDEVWPETGLGLGFRLGHVSWSRFGVRVACQRLGGTKRQI
jgi:hypothetical protein